MERNDEYKLQAMNRKQAERAKQRSETMGNGYKYDNLNGGRMKPEYVDEQKQAQQDSYNHTVQLSAGFTDWLNETYRNQEAERKERIERMKENMFAEREPHPMDKAIRDRLRERETLVQLRNRMRDVFFSDAEISELHENQKSNNPIDIDMRKP